MSDITAVDDENAFAADEAVRLACELIRRRSVTPEDAGCQTLMAERLAALDFRIEHLRYGDTDNLWARRGESDPVFCFAGHTDVVPPGDLDAWSSDPFEPTFSDGLLYGRGAADMKSSLAAMLVATERFLAAHPDHDGSIAFLITSDEEGPARDGTKRVIETLQERSEHIDWCVLGEPSSQAALGDIVRNGRRGSLSGILKVRGIQGHVAYPQLADNPIQRFAPALAELYATPLDDGNEYFPPTSFQVVNVQAGIGAPNVTPGELNARFNFRYSTEWTHESLAAHVESILDRHGLDYELHWHLSGKPFLTEEGVLTDAVTAAVREELGVAPELSTGGGTSDGRFISPAGAQVVELGPVNASIHKIDEHVRVEDIVRLTAVYERILEALLAR
ncbi:succinyl-diaminopimelate desuccinylase [Lentisalinibacter salinarum]|uniref:succinyl-diaminopimelate desuccinylase n=1 Tax=Lentisalinibacter salinarum TaxID=2992239 RepID=UPI0038697E0C